MNKTLMRAKRRIESLEDEIADVAGQAGETLIRQLMLDFPEICRFVSGNGTLFFEIGPEVELRYGDEGDPTLVGEIDPDFRVFGDEGDFFGWLSGLARAKELKERTEEISEFLWDYVGFLPFEIKREDL